MPTFTGKAFANFYKNLLGINQTGNTGVDATTRTVQDGAGNNSSLSLSDDVLQVQPVNDNTKGTLLAKNSGGSNILAVDTINSKVLVGASQVAANTMYQTFSTHWMTPVAGYHMLLHTTPIPAFGVATVEDDLGNGVDPATTYDMSSGSNASQFVNSLWRVQDNITIDAASFFISSAGSSTDTYNVHIMSYDIDTDNGVTSGDLSSGTVVVDSGTIASDRTAVDYLGTTIQSADVNAGKVLIATLESDGTDSVSINMTMKYHIR